MMRYSGTGFDPDGVAKTEADHFGNCPICGAYLDMRDLHQVLAHVHDAEIEISEGPTRPPSGPWQRLCQKATQCILPNHAELNRRIRHPGWP